ncbi:MAG: hypothetical protein LBQ28_00075 [Prevotellaceae bacterium]|jgi:hypothetical protein|nr:hypothetical protein [Prevotellaceae bacterium]
MKRNTIFMRAMAGLIAVALMVGGCSKDDVKPAEPTLTVDQTTINAPAEGDAYVVKVTSNTTWNVSVGANSAWCTISPTSKDGNGDLNITVAENTDTQQRTTTVTITAGTITRQINVTQAAKGEDALELSVDKTTIPATAAASSYSIGVTSNAAWMATVNSESSGWCTLTNASATGNGTITVNVAQNAATTQRTATVTVAAGSVTRQVIVTQAAAATTEGFSLSITGSQIYLDVYVQNITINWGDGHQETSNNSGYQTLAHFYNTSGTYNIVATATQLTHLDCHNSHVTSLNVDNLPLLQTLVCYENQITNLNVSNNTALTTLQCSNNQLSNLNLTNNTVLRVLSCDGNMLGNLNVSACPQLEELHCQINYLTNLNISGCMALIMLECQYNQLTNLDVSDRTSLIHLSCVSNNLISLNASGCTALPLVYCETNMLTSLNVNGCTSLTNVAAKENQLSATAINTVFTDLPTVSYGTIDVQINTGSSTCDASIAEDKGWTVFR